MDGSQSLGVYTGLRHWRYKILPVKCALWPASNGPLRTAMDNT